MQVNPPPGSLRPLTLVDPDRAALAAEVREHPTPRTARSRALEAALAPALRHHPPARAAAARFVGQLRRLADWADPQHPPWPWLLGAFTVDAAGQRRPRFTQVGDIGAADVTEALAGDDPRLLLTMARNAEGYFATLLACVARRAEREPLWAARLAAAVGLDLAALRARAARQGPAAPLLAPPADSAVALLDGMRRPRPRSAQQAPLRLDDPQLSPLERRHQRRRSWAAGGGPQAVMMAHGRTLFAAEAAHPWHRAARAAGMHTAVSISGTTYRLLAMARLLDPAPAHAAALTLALLAHLVPLHHSHHEVMAAAAEHGVAYVPGVGPLRALAARLAATPLSTAAPAAAKAARAALQRALDDTAVDA